MYPRLLPSALIALGSIFSFVSAFFPSWDLTWGRTVSESGERIPISVQGRIAFGVYFGYVAAAILLGGLWPSLWYLLIAIAGALLGGMYYMYLKDRRKHDASKPGWGDPTGRKSSGR
jgi:hypothetical protein